MGALFFFLPLATVTMASATIGIDDASNADSIFDVKQRVLNAQPQDVRASAAARVTADPCGMDALAHGKTLGGTGVAQDGSAELNAQVANLTEADAEELCNMVYPLSHARVDTVLCVCRFCLQTFHFCWCSRILICVCFVCGGKRFSYYIASSLSITYVCTGTVAGSLDAWSCERCF
jgi:hypothetical protein